MNVAREPSAQPNIHLSEGTEYHSSDFGPDYGACG